MKRLIKNNYIPILFAFVAVCMELTAVYVTSGRLLIRRPWLYLSMLAILTLLQYFLRTNRARHICASILLSIFFVCDLVFIVIYEMTGTIFDFSMLKLRGDAMAILESVPINFTYTAISGILLSAFIVFGRTFAAEDGNAAFSGFAKRALTLCLALVLVLHLSLTYLTVAEANDSSDLAETKLYEPQEGGYADKGILGNLVSELYQGAFDEVEIGDTEEIEQFFYQSVTGEEIPMFGAAEGYNVVTVLAESFEWFSFLCDEARYPNGYHVDETVLRELYPNLYSFYDTSYVMSNFHSREKTDISENLSIIGNYPLDYYLNYDYSENNIAYSLPNVMRLLYGVESNSFHNGTNSFYNRDEYLPNAVGFSSFVASDEMEAQGMTNYFDLGERNLDSEMIETCKEQMFPTDCRFNTYITTITMHGQYAHRDNLQEYYDILDTYGLLPLQEDNENANAFRYYAAAAMELDRAVGVMMDYLEETGLLDHTLIVIFGDHNVYYQSLSNYVKDIYPKSDPSADITELYRVPLMIKVGAQSEQVVIDKFTCTADIQPTILSLLGIRYYDNLYYGNSVFSEEESLLYSRAYDVFFTDQIYFTSLDHIVWASPQADESYQAEIEQRAVTLMEKLSYVNRMFAADLFRSDALTRFEENMRSINP